MSSMTNCVGLLSALCLLSSAARAEPSAAACELLSPSLVAEKLGIQGLVAKPTPSNLGGASCELKEAEKPISTRMTFQMTSEKAEQFFHPESESASAEPVHGEGYEAALVPPENGTGNSRFVVKKGKTFASLTLWSKSAYSAAQFRALFDAVVSKL